MPTHYTTHCPQLLVANTSLKILNICYTNHALDAFLEDLLAAGITDIVRIGGKSQSDKMQNYQLRELTVSTVCLSSNDCVNGVLRVSCGLS
jgi:hypothetical protein